MKRLALFSALIIAAAASAGTPVTPDSLGRAAGDSATTADTRDSVRYSAETITYSRADSLLTLCGKARLEQGGMNLSADTILFYTGPRRLVAFGAPVLNDGGNRIAGERMTYLLNEKKGRIDYGSARSQSDIYNGEVIARMPDQSFFVKNGDFSTCEIDSAPHYFFFGANMHVVPRDKIIARPVVINVGDVPVGVLPYFIFPIKRGRQSGLLMPRIGQMMDNGSPAFYVKNVGYYFALNDYMDLETKLDFRNGQGFFFQQIFLDANLNYNKRYWLNGSLDARMDVSRSDLSSSNNWGLSYNHNQELLPDGSFKLSGSGNLVGNSQYYRQSSLERTDYLRRELSSNMGLTKNWRDLGLSSNLNFRYHENLDTRTKELELPAFSFNSINRPFYTREREPGTQVPPDSLAWYERLSWGYAMRGGHKRATTLSSNQSLLDTTVDTSQHLVNSAATDMHSGFSFGLSPAPKLGPVNIFPSFGLSSDFYFARRDRGPLLGIRTSSRWGKIAYDTVYAWDTIPGFNHREYYNAGVRLNTQMYGVSTFKLGRLAGFRHILSPSLGYSFSPAMRERLDLITAGNTDNRRRDEQQSVDMGLDNTFQIKLAGDAEDPQSSGQTITLTNLGLGTNYNFKGTNRAGKVVGRWGDISSHAGTQIYFVNLNYNGQHTLYDLNSDRLLPMRAGPLLARLPQLAGYSLEASTGASLSGKFSNGEWSAEPLSAAVAASQLSPVKMNPWTLSFDFRYNYTSAYNTAYRVMEKRSSFSLNDNLTLMFSDNWKMSYHSRYDFQKNDLVEQGMNLVRDFHCWDATFDWIISGYSPGFYFRVAIKEIPDVKFEKRGGQYGSFGGSGMSLGGDFFNQ